MLKDFQSMLGSILSKLKLTPKEIEHEIDSQSLMKDCEDLA